MNSRNLTNGLPAIRCVLRLSSRLPLLSTLLLSFSLLPSYADTPLPAVPPGFKITLFAKDPEITHPTSLSAAPGNVVYVAQEYWNAKQPNIPQSAIIKRFVDRDGDGVADEMKVVWDNGLNSVQGMRWFEGALYLMHAPVLTALRDTDGDGIPDKRQDLLVGQAPDSRSRIAGHLISGVIAWIDGRLYITCGDEGWWKCKTPEGGEFELHGGGILRCRPDGSGLEAWCTGLRNPYGTMAMDADGNGFTRDNTNDGQGWNCRFSQIFPHAFYGYPYHFKNYPEEIVPALDDYGLGYSPTGGVCYLEDRFPGDFHGNLFFNDWGRRNVVRYALKPEGVVRKGSPEEFLTGGHGDGYDTRPIGIDVDENGNLLVADWSWGGWGWTNNPKGRIFRVTYGGTGVTPPLPAAKKDVAGWAADLAAPGFHARFRAQRELERAGAAAAPKLREVLAGGPLDAKIHAMWALARVDGDKAVPDLLKILNESPEERLRLHAARILGDGGVGTGGIDALVARLSNDSPRMRMQAAAALGWLGAARAAPALLKASAHDDPYVRLTIAYALRATGESDACLKALHDPDARVRDAALIALRERYEMPVLHALARAAKSHPDAALRVRAVRALARVGRKPKPWDGVYWSFWPKTDEYPFGTEAWEGTGEVGRALAELLKDRDREIRMQAAVALQHVRDEGSAAVLAEALGREADEGVTAAIVSALEAAKSPKAYKALAAVVRQSSKPASLRLRALMVANALPDLPAADAAARESLTNDYLKSVSSGGPDARIDALRGLAEVKAVFAASWIVGRLDDNDARVRDAALRALGSMGDAKGFEAAQRLLSDPAPEVRRAAVWTYAKLAPKNADLAPLQPLLKDADLSVVREALAALLQKKGDAAKQLASGLFTPFVRRWMAVGPFPNKENKAFAATFPPEQGLQLDAQYDGDGGRVGWKEIVSETDEVMLEKHLADRTEVAAYAAAAVESKEACDVLLLLGSDDDVKVWVNGELVHLKQTGRAVRKDNDIARAKLRKGVNSVLFKVVNGSGPWGLCLRFAVPRGADALSFPEPRTALAPVRKDLLQKQALTGGDPVAGEAVFRGGKTNCERCHAVKGAGNRVGPELTGIGAKYPREHLIESVLYPSRKLSQGFQAVTIVTTDERTLSGIVASETPVQVTLVGSDGVPVTVPVSEIATRHPQPVSIMPEGLETALSDEEFVDLIAFLESLR